MTRPARTDGRQPVLAVELLSDPDYRRYWLGSTAFALGIWGFLVSMGVSARILTDSPLRISLVSVAYFLPMFLLALPSGVLADTVDRRLTVIVSRSVSAAGGLVLAALTASDRLGYGALLALCALTGAPVVSEVAARQAYVTQVVRPDQVVGATALGSVQGGIARVVGPLVAGWLIGQWGQASGYLFFAAANLACVWVFLRIRASGVPERSGGRPLAELVDGLDPKPPEGTAYVAWMMVNDKLGYPIVRVEPNSSGRVAERYAIPTPVRDSIAQIATDVRISATDAAELQQSIREAADAGQPVLRFTGETLSEGAIPLSGAGEAGAPQPST